MNRIDRWKDFLVPKLRHLAEFLVTQGIALAARLLCGFVIVRLLPISDYAKFAVVFGFWGTMVVLMDVGFSGTIVALIGQRVGDHQLIADYLASLRHMIRRLYLVVAFAAAFVFPVLVRNQHWSWKDIAAMEAILLVAAWCERISGTYWTVLIVCRDRAALYRAQMIAGLGSLALVGFLWAVHGLNAYSAMLANVAGTVFLAAFYFFRSRHLLGNVGRASRQMRREIVHLALPNLPPVIFYAFQGQISILLITWFGHAAAVAGVGALGRLAQIFLLFSQMNPMLIQPYFARLPMTQLKRNYLAMAAVQGVFCLFVTGLARVFPDMFLWILGRNYSGLRYEVFLMMAGASVSYFVGVLVCIHSARKFVYWWGAVANISLTLAVQVFFIWKMDLSTVRGVLILNLASALVVLLLAVCVGIYGFLYGPRDFAMKAMGEDVPESGSAAGDA